MRGIFRIEAPPIHSPFCPLFSSSFLLFARFFSYSRVFLSNNFSFFIRWNSRLLCCCVWLYQQPGGTRLLYIYTIFFVYFFCCLLPLIQNFSQFSWFPFFSRWDFYFGSLFLRKKTSVEVRRFFFTRWGN